MILASETTDDARVVISHLENLQRSEISTPPAFGARVASTILQDPELRAVWKEDLKRMSARLAKMRQRLYQELKALGMQILIVLLIEDLGADCYRLPPRLQSCCRPGWYVLHPRIKCGAGATAERYVDPCNISIASDPG